MYALPKPGQYLPKVNRKYDEKDRVTVDIDYQSNNATVIEEFSSAKFSPLSCYAIH